jgi:mannose-6-phosphate isomerase-like protein (cupin superfamily)
MQNASGAATGERVKYLPAKGGRAFAAAGTSIQFKDEPSENGDTLCLFELRFLPGATVPPHYESDNSEAFFIIEGRLEMEVDGQHYDLGPGDFVRWEPGVVHSLRNPGPGRMRCITWTTPGMQHVRFFEGVCEQIEDPDAIPEPTEPSPEERERMDRVAAENGLNFLGSSPIGR